MPRVPRLFPACLDPIAKMFSHTVHRATWPQARSRLVNLSLTDLDSHFPFYTSSRVLGLRVFYAGRAGRDQWIRIKATAGKRPGWVDGFEVSSHALTLLMQLPATSQLVD